MMARPILTSSPSRSSTLCLPCRLYLRHHPFSRPASNRSSLTKNSPSNTTSTTSSQNSRKTPSSLFAPNRSANTILENAYKSLIPPRQQEPKSSSSNPSSSSSTSALRTTSLTDPYRPPDPHHLHIYATRHNTHITLTTPGRNPLISLSAGNLRFKKAARGSYDAAFQLGVYFLQKVREKGLLIDKRSRRGGGGGGGMYGGRAGGGSNAGAFGEAAKDALEDPEKGNIKTLEVVFRDFGKGREALQKVLLGSEASVLRGKVVRMMDATRIKFGGTRSRKMRRL